MSALSVNGSTSAANSYLSPLGKDKEDEHKKNMSSLPKEEPKDEYIPGDEKPENTSVKYRLLENEKGGKRIVEVKPESKPGESEPAAKPGEKPAANPAESPEKGTGSATVNTDKVDAEIKALKQRLQQIQQRINSASDENSRAAAQKELAQVSSELSAKDNDGYRKANASTTERYA